MEFRSGWRPARARRTGGLALPTGLVVCLGLASAVAAEAPPDFVGLQLALARMMESPPARAASTRQAFVNARQLVDEFLLYIEELGDSGTQYEPSVRHLTDVLSRVADETEDTAETLATLADVEEDLTLKLESFRARMGAAGTTAPLWVRVTVRTLSQGRPISGLWVHAVPYRYRDTTPRWTFAQLSSPTTEMILPGKQCFFASRKDPAERLGLRCVRIGAALQEELTLDLQVAGD